MEQIKFKSFKLFIFKIFYALIYKRINKRRLFELDSFWDKFTFYLLLDNFSFSANVIWIFLSINFWLNKIQDIRKILSYIWQTIVIESRM
jgi:hypothetical protein